LVCPFFIDRKIRSDLSEMDVLPESMVIVILAAGKGTRMKSETAKVLHRISGRPMILYVVDTAVRAAGSGVLVVVGTQAGRVRDLISKTADVMFALQPDQKGTGHAVLCALPHLPQTCRDVLILSGDVPLIRPETMVRLAKTHMASGNAVTLIGLRLENPYGYGRIVQSKGGRVERIVEESDASESEKLINIVNSGIYCIKRAFLETSLPQIQTNNAQHEVYLTDIIEIARQNGQDIGLMLCEDPRELTGVNTLEELRRVEALLCESGKNLDFKTD